MFTSHFKPNDHEEIMSVHIKGKLTQSGTYLPIPEDQILFKEEEPHKLHCCVPGVVSLTCLR